LQNKILVQNHSAYCTVDNDGHYNQQMSLHYIVSRRHHEAWKKADYYCTTATDKHKKIITCTLIHCQLEMRTVTNKY